MKTLLILRHGKAEHYNETSDNERVLTDRGVRDARHMGRLIAKLGYTIDLVASSDAARASQTARLAAETAGHKSKIDFRPEIYGASSRTLLEIVRSLPQSAKTVLLVGHNPGMEELASDLAGGIGEHLPTAGLIVITLKGAWEDAEIDSGDRIGMYGPGD